MKQSFALLALALILAVLVADSAEYYAGLYDQPWRAWAVALALEIGTAALVLSLNGDGVAPGPTRFYGWAAVLVLTLASLTGAGYRLAGPALLAAQGEARALEYKAALERAASGQGANARYFLMAGQKTNAAKALGNGSNAEADLLALLKARNEQPADRHRSPVELALLWLSRAGLQLTALILAHSLGTKAHPRGAVPLPIGPQQPARPAERPRNQRGQFEPLKPKEEQ